MEPDRQPSEAEICMVLDTFMYLDYKEAQDGTSLSDILKDLEHHPDYGGGGIHYGEYSVLCQAAENDAIGNLVIGCQSREMGYASGTAACTFSTTDGETVYVVYRGTGDGEWPDNGLGMTQSVTTQQQEALQYFEEVVEKLHIDENQRLVVTGHSKGANKAQFVIMETKMEELIDVCYSVDGQGFSEKAITRWKDNYGEEGYRERTMKLRGIHGENDYVNVLGNSIIPKENIRYIKTPVDKNNFAGYHDIKYMFATSEYDSKTQTFYTRFHGRKNADAIRQGELSRYASALSKDVMELAPDKRDGCAAVVMQMMEASAGSKKGINGEKLKLSDISDFTFLGIPIIAGSLFCGEEGKGLLQAFRNKTVLSGAVPGSLILQVNDKGLQSYGDELDSIAGQIAVLEQQLHEAAGKVPVYMKGSTALHHRIELSAGRIQRLRGKLLKAAELRKQISSSYRCWNEEIAEMTLQD